MKVFGISDDSEYFSLLLTAIIGILLFIFTYVLNERVMGRKRQSEVSCYVTLLLAVT